MTNPYPGNEENPENSSHKWENQTPAENPTPENNYGYGVNNASAEEPQAANPSAYPQPYGQAPAYGAPLVNQNSTDNKLGVVALILGIVSIVFVFIPFTSILAPLVAIAGIVVSIIALVKVKDKAPEHKRKGMSIAGLVLSIITLVIIIAVIIFAVGFARETGVMECMELPTTAAQQACIEQIADDIEQQLQ